MSRLIDADKLIKSIESDRNCSDMPSQWIDGVNYAIDLIELYEPTIKTKQIKYYDEDESVWKVGSVIVNTLHDLTDSYKGSEYNGIVK